MTLAAQNASNNHLNSRLCIKSHRICAPTLSMLNGKIVVMSVKTVVLFTRCPIHRWDPRGKLQTGISPPPVLPCLLISPLALTPQVPIDTYLFWFQVFLLEGGEISFILGNSEKRAVIPTPVQFQPLVKCYGH